MDIVRSLPSTGLHPSTELYNQLLEHSARTHNYRQAKSTLRLMACSRPPVPLDVISYAHVIHCFADSRKPRSALAAFQQMRQQGVAPSCSVYMGVLKALVHLRDGFKAAQVRVRVHGGQHLNSLLVSPQYL
jgi:pentatricopeptide repeat protein